jgi:hypothetical protein
MVSADDEAISVRIQVLQNDRVVLFIRRRVYILRQDDGAVVTSRIKSNPGSIEITKVTKIAKATGCRYGGAATMCKVDFKFDGGAVHSAYFARVSETAYYAGDVYTALLMPLPGGAFFPIS